MKLILRRRDTDALLEGKPLGDDAGLDDVEAFLAGMRTEFGAAAAPEPRPTLAATLDGRRPLRPATNPSPKLTFPKPKPRTHRLRPVVAVFATGAVLFGGLASAGALPGPVQRTTAELGSHVGIHLPGAPTARPVPDDIDSGSGPTDAPRSGDSQRGGSTATTVPSPSSSATSSTTGPSTLPTTPTVPTTGVTPTVPTLPQLPIPNVLDDPLRPLLPLPGLPGSPMGTGVVHGRLIP